MSPTMSPAMSPTASPTKNCFECKDRNDLKFGRRKKSCKWVKRGSKKKVKKKCRKKSKKIRIWDWCPATCGKVDLGKCAGIII
mmetsp:Transcript_22175/g.61744  ORF Transcript_22175/g.61744 Transcript_22175/m.61744 type:complete len:83 (-) Transcript_22175:2802-3050(-)